MKNKALILIFLLVLGMIVSPVCAWTTLWTGTGANDNHVNPQLNGRFQFRTGGQADFNNNITKFVWVGTGTDYCNPTLGKTGSFTHAYTENGVVKGTADIEWSCTGLGAYNSTNTISITFNNKTGTFGAGNYPITFAAFYEHIDMTIDYNTYTPASAVNSIQILGGGGTTYYPSGTYYTYGGSAVTAPVASFTCSPLSQFPDEDVVCTDTSSNTPTDWLWTLDYEALGIKGWQTSTSRNFTWQSHYTGIFGVNLYANNSAGGSWYNRSNYVEISDNATPIGIDDPIPAGYIRSMVQCVNPEDSSLISDCAISIKDIEGNAWSNGSFHGTWFIDTLPLHHINAYGSASGYTSAYRLNLDASSSLMYELFLFPGYLPPASDGHVRLYAIVNDYTTGAPVLNAQVEFKGSGESTQIKYTSVSGIAQVEWANVSTVYVSASKAGYSPASRTIVTTSTGPDTVRLELSAPWVTLPVTSGTPLPGEFTVRPTQDPNKNPDGSYVAGYSNIKGQEMMNWLAEYGFQLVQLCFFVTILGLLGVKLGGK